MMTPSQLAETVDRWHVPPECQGQIIELAYGVAEDGIPMRRTTDRSDHSVAYTLLDQEAFDALDEGEWEPWNREPSIGDAP